MEESVQGGANTRGVSFGFQPECFACWVRRSYEAAKEVTDEKYLQLEVMKRVTRQLMELNLDDFVSTDSVELLFRIIKEVTGKADAYRALKADFNSKAIALYPALKQRVARSKDRLLTAMLIASAGNSADEANDLSSDLEESVGSALEAGHKFADYQGFKDALSASERILYIADNAGEIVFDRVLIEEIGGNRVTCVVKGAAISTDATIEDAKLAGIDHIARVITTEADHPLRIVGSAAKELAQAMDEADMIISKGNLNYEVLTQLQRPAFYLFKLKCDSIRRTLPTGSNFELGDVVLIKQ
jgi:uncharacterized protein with ATP-grasp and redox domains